MRPYLTPINKGQDNNTNPSPSRKLTFNHNLALSIERQLS